MPDKINNIMGEGFTLSELYVCGPRVKSAFAKFWDRPHGVLRPSYSVKTLFENSAQSIAEINRVFLGDLLNESDINPRRLRQNPEQVFKEQHQIFKDSMNLLARLDFDPELRAMLDSLEENVDNTRDLLQQQQEKLQDRRQRYTKRKIDFYLWDNLSFLHGNNAALEILRSRGYLDLINKFLSFHKQGLDQTTKQNSGESQSLQRGRIQLIQHLNMPERKPGEDAPVTLAGRISRDFDYPPAFYSTGLASNLSNEQGGVSAIDLAMHKIELPLAKVTGPRAAKEIDMELAAEDLQVLDFTNFGKVQHVLPVPFGYELKQLEFIAEDTRQPVNFDEAKQDTLNTVHIHGLQNCTGFKYRVQPCARPVLSSDLPIELFEPYPKNDQDDIDISLFNIKYPSVAQKVEALIKDFKARGAEYTTMYADKFDNSKNVYEQFDEHGPKGLCHELSICFCNELRRHGVPAFVTNGDLGSMLDPEDNQEKFVVDPRHMRVSYLDERKHIFVIDPSELAQQEDQNSSDGNNASAPEQSSPPLDASSGFGLSSLDELDQEATPNDSFGNIGAQGSGFSFHIENVITPRIRYSELIRAVEVYNQSKKDWQQVLTKGGLIESFDLLIKLFAAYELITWARGEHCHKLKADLNLRNFAHQVQIQPYIDEFFEKFEQKGDLKVDDLFALMHKQMSMRDDMGRFFNLSDNIIHPPESYLRVFVDKILSSEIFPKLSCAQIDELRRILADEDFFNIHWEDFGYGGGSVGGAQLKILNSFMRALLEYQEQDLGSEQNEFIKQRLELNLKAILDCFRGNYYAAEDYKDAFKLLLRQDPRLLETLIIRFQFADLGNDTAWYEGFFSPRGAGLGEEIKASSFALTLLRSLLEDREMMYDLGLNQYFNYDIKNHKLSFTGKYQEIFDRQIQSIINSTGIGSSQLRALLIFEELGIDVKKSFANYDLKKLFVRFLSGGEYGSLDVSCPRINPYDDYNRFSGQFTSHANHIHTRAEVEGNVLARLLGFDLESISHQDLSDKGFDFEQAGKQTLDFLSYTVNDDCHTTCVEPSNINSTALAFMNGFKQDMKAEALEEIAPEFSKTLKLANISVEKIYSLEESQEIAHYANKLYPEFSNRLKAILRRGRKRFDTGMLYYLFENGFRDGAAVVSRIEQLKNYAAAYPRIVQELSRFFDQDDYNPNELKENSQTIKNIFFACIENPDDKNWYRTFMQGLTEQETVLFAVLLARMQGNDFDKICKYFYGEAKRGEVTVYKNDEPRSVYLEADLPSTGLIGRIKNLELKPGSLNPLAGFKEELCELGANSRIDAYKLSGGDLPINIKVAVDKLAAGQRPKIHEKELKLRPGNSDQKFMRSSKRDSGFEPSSHRFYVPGDPVKNIDWKKTSKLDHSKAVVKQFGAPQARIKDYVLDLASFNFNSPYTDDRAQFEQQQVNKLAAILETLIANVRNKQHQALYISYQGQMIAAYNEEELKNYVLSFKKLNDALGERRLIEDFMQDLLYLANLYSFSRYELASPLIASGFDLHNAADHKLILLTDNQKSLEMTMPKIKDLASKGFSFAYGLVA